MMDRLEAELHTEEEQKELEKAQQELIKLASVYDSAFRSEHGSLVLEHLEASCDRSVLSPTVFMTDLNAQVTPENFAFIREGQNQVIRYIKKMINIWQDYTFKNIRP